MRLRPYLFLIPLLPMISHGQVLEKITVVAQKTSDLQTITARPDYRIEYMRLESGNFEALYFLEGTARRPLTANAIIEKDRLDQVAAWKASRKKLFTASDVYTTDDSLRSFDPKQWELNLDVPLRMEIRTDSFKYCQGFRQQAVRATDGFIIRITLTYDDKSEKVTTFSADDTGKAVFNLMNYLYFYRIFHDRIPKGFQQYEFFTTRNLINTVGYYQKTVECEDYYYAEFVKEYPDRSIRATRKRNGWNFAKYIKQRKKANAEPATHGN